MCNMFNYLFEITFFHCPKIESIFIPRSVEINICIDDNYYFYWGDFEDGSSFKLNAGSPMNPVYTGPWTISINEDVTLTYAGEGDNPLPELAGTYIRYVHPEAWPVLSSSNTTYPAN